MNKKVVVFFLSLTSVFVYTKKVDRESPGLRECVHAFQQLDVDKVKNVVGAYPNINLNQLNPVSGMQGSTEGSHTSPLVMVLFYSLANRRAEHDQRIVGAISHPVVKQFRIIETLARLGVNFNVRDDYTDGTQHMHHLWWQNTPLTICARRSGPDAAAIAEVMLRDGNADPDFPDSRGQTPLYIASKVGNYEWVKLLLDNKAKVDQEVDLKMVDNHRDTPLIAAARKRHCKVIDLLLDRSADANKTNVYGANALMCFVNERKDKDSEESLTTLAALIAVTEDINARSTRDDVDGGIRTGETALTLAARATRSCMNSATLDALLRDPRIELPNTTILDKESEERIAWEIRCAEIPLKHILKAVKERRDAQQSTEQ